jgi:hypothetical protein
MNKINLGRVLLGGLAAGAIMNLGEFLLNGVILANLLKSDLGRLNLPEPSGSFIGVAVLMTFILGIVIVFLYAAIKPRFGGGAKTAIAAGLIAWFFVYIYTGVLNTMLGLLAGNILLIGIAWGVFEYSVGAMAGAWLYKETE